MMELLKAENLKMYYKTSRGHVRAVDSIDFGVDKGKVLGLVGESGCGKTSAALAILRLLPSNGRIMGGNIIFDGESLLELSDKEFRRRIRWKRISVIFQGAMNALHPIKKIGDQIAEPIMLHEHVEEKEALDRAGKLLDLVGIGAERINRFPHELSGGMKQRAMVAMSLACNPELVIADEPTTALDVIIATQVLRIIKELQHKLGLSMILITHDLSMVAETSDKVAVMYGGKIAENGDVESIFKKPLHPYTQKLIDAFPSIIGPKRALSSIPGFPPDLLNPAPGCRFHPRCPYTMEICRKEEPMTMSIDRGHVVACHLMGG
jgi:peptide/nickel transport system ATP-binding protein